MLGKELGRTEADTSALSYVVQRLFLVERTYHYYGCFDLPDGLKLGTLLH